MTDVLFTSSGGQSRTRGWNHLLEAKFRAILKEPVYLQQAVANLKIDVAPPPDPDRISVDLDIGSSLQLFF